MRADIITATHAHHPPGTQVSPLPMELCAAYYTEKKNIYIFKSSVGYSGYNTTFK
jgi:hypothetical protein